MWANVLLINFWNESLVIFVNFLREHTHVSLHLGPLAHSRNSPDIRTLLILKDLSWQPGQGINYCIWEEKTIFQ